MPAETSQRWMQHPVLSGGDLTASAPALYLTIFLAVELSVDTAD